jgi:hypothetical protein
MYGMAMAVDAEEMKTLDTAIKYYLKVCRREVKKGRDAPFWAHGYTLRRLPASQRKFLRRYGRLELLEGDVFALQAALKTYLAQHEQGTADGPNIEFAADRSKFEKVLARLSDEFCRVAELADARYASQQWSGD